MGEEVELKLALSPRALSGLLRSDALKRRGIRFGPPRSLVTVYFDTARDALREKGIFLRVRRAGRRFEQTVKTAGEGGPLARRGEWNWPLRSAKPDLALAASTGLKPLAKRARKNDLAPRHASEIRRRIAHHSEGETLIELALDQGLVRAGRRTQKLLELELELKSGPVGPLFALARELVAQPGVRVSLETKAARGFALAEGRRPGAVRAESTALTPGLSVTEAAALVLESCAAQAAANLPILAQRRIPEAAHQARVAMRRLRAGLGLFKEVLPDDIRKRLRKQAGRLADALADARGYDVLSEETLVGAIASPTHPDMPALARTLARARAAAWRKAVQAATAPAASLLVLDLAEAAAMLRGMPVAAESPPLIDLARSQLESRLEQILLLAQDPDTLGIDERHHLRLAFKKLRYALDFFEALFPRKAMKPMLKVLTRLQDSLGAFNDAASAAGLIEAAIRRAPARECAALGRAALFVEGWAANEAEREWTRARALIAEFAATGPFWRMGL